MSCNHHADRLFSVTDQKKELSNKYLMMVLCSSIDNKDYNKINQINAIYLSRRNVYIIYNSDNFREQYTRVRTEQIHFDFINFAGRDLFYTVIWEHPNIS